LNIRLTTPDSRLSNRRDLAWKWYSFKELEEIARYNL